MISLHSHSGQFCRHAKGQLEEVVQEAIHKGFTVYGLSEHVPRYRVEDLYPEEADLTLEELERTFDAYVEEASRLKQTYSNRIELLIGLETECITQESLTHLQSLLKKHEDTISYIVGSVHHVNGIPIDFDKETFDKALRSFPNVEGGLSQLDQLFCAYFDAQFNLLRLCQPEVIGHIDLCRLYLPQASFEEDEVWSRVTRNVECAISYGALFEVNAAAFRKGWKTAYPAQDVLELILSKGGRLTLSDDSHGPHAVGLHYKDAHQYLVKSGVSDLYFLSAESEASNNCPSSPLQTERVERTGARRSTRVLKLERDWANHVFWQHV
ncbi:histidinol phosphate phosphatase H [Cystobasidium minutum MCA 4210]|uniref:histidinol phosphate phosphatase H n=1 Tax=Cystobasidium minutum MCA 4210 TaxID=1397322 RepID=UPI0034CE1C93|eukprot:jgi/Rhomi1/197765/gm1.5979_g